MQLGFSAFHDLCNNITYIYQHANIRLIGTFNIMILHLGGYDLLTNVTFGAPIVSLEGPGEELAATCLHPPSPACVFHFPVFVNIA